MTARKKTAKQMRKSEDDERANEAGRESFPASDPPSYAGGGTRVGSPAPPGKRTGQRGTSTAKKRK